MKKVIIVSLLLAPAASYANGGHGSIDPNTMAHWLLEPVHVIPVLALAGVITLVWLRVRKTVSKND